jgi:DMSO reductase anchor subunit
MDLSGIYPPVPTFFAEDESLDLPTLHTHITRLRGKGITRFVALGSNGEAVHLDLDERRAVIAAIREAAGADAQILAGAGTDSTRATIALCRLAAEAGADAALVLPPHYYRSRMSLSALAAHFRAVAEESPIPVVLYNVPANTAGVDLDAETVIGLSPHPNIAGIKDTGGNLAKMAEIVAGAHEGFDTLAGNAGMLLPALAVGALLWRGTPGPTAAPLLAVSGIVLALCALATVACTAMIYASLKPIPAWRHPLVLPVYLLFALLTGLALLFALMLAMPGHRAPGAMLLALASVAALRVVLKWRYWRDIVRDGLPGSRGAAIGLPGREATVFERPHTEANYITREMAFQVARQHARRLRVGACALVVGGPLLGYLLLAACGPAFALGAAATLLLAGAFVERWLFFAQARHVVTLYY